MTDASADNVMIDGYHGHVYYTAETRPLAERLRETIAGRFGIDVQPTGSGRSRAPVARQFLH